MSREAWLFRQKDITRAFKAARAAGVTARIDIAPDGTIRISELTPPVEAPKPAPNATPAPGLRSSEKFTATTTQLE